jgi:urease accessory protein
MSDRRHPEPEGRAPLISDATAGAVARVVRAAASNWIEKGVAPMLLIEQVVGSRLEPDLSERLHELEHRGAVDLVMIPAADVARRRLRVTTRGGADVAIALPRDQHLFDGAVLLVEPDRAIVVRVDEQRWLRLQPRAIADAIELGYHAGNLHWRVRFEGEALLVALEAPMDDYLARLGTLVTDRRVVPSLVTQAGTSS